MGLNLNQNGQQSTEDKAKEDATANQTVASGEAAAGLEKAIESADTANPLTPTIDGNDAANNSGGAAAGETVVVEGEDLAGNEKLVEVNESTPVKNVIATYSSSPITNFSVGRFVFKDGVLSFSDDEADDHAEFESIINDKNFPPQEKAKIVKIDIGAAERLVAELRSKQGGATQATDSTVGERVSKPKSVGNLGSTGNRGN